MRGSALFQPLALKSAVLLPVVWVLMYRAAVESDTICAPIHSMQASEEHKTMVPSEKSVCKNPPIKQVGTRCDMSALSRY